MAIDVNVEQTFSLTDACKLLPRRRAGRKPAVATLYRWSTVGCRGIVLESIQIGGTRCTSAAALQRFFDRLTAQAQGTRPAFRSPAARNRAVAAAVRELEQMGA